MSDYTPSTNFAAKDALTSGNPAKIIKGTEISAEFTAIQTAVASKADSSSSSSFTAGNTSVTSLSDAGNLTFTGTGNRITGDFGNATIASRVMFQTSTVNGATSVSALPNGTATQSDVFAFNSSDANNAGLFLARASATEVTLRSAITGTGTYLPMTFYTGGSERMRIDTSGNVSVQGGYMAIGSSSVAGQRLRIASAGSTSSSYALTGINSSVQTLFLFSDDGTSTFNLGAFGYGTGAGGTVTQATSRTTAVTLNKPCGAITMFSAAGSATAATFVVNNSLVAATDVIVLTWRGASNVYQMIANSQADGSFQITFFTTGGTAVDAPVIQFAIIKGVNA